MFNLGSVSKDDDKDYSVTCQGPCKNVEVKLTSGSGDPDLYVKPVRSMNISLLARRLDKTIFQTPGCADSSCYLCQSVDPGTADICSGISTQAAGWVVYVQS